ncbi:MAG: DMT family transporter [Kosmotoga sp.]|nr:MAG: DMT family transporter [Kosmotoga sp.]
MITGLFFSILAGIVIAAQSVFSARLGEKVGFYGANFLIHGTGFLLAMLLLFLFGKGELSLNSLKELNPLYATAGFIGVVIIFSIAQGVSKLGASRGVLIIVITQIILALIINVNGWFGEQQLSLTPAKGIGLVLMITGIIVYQLAR